MTSRGTAPTSPMRPVRLGVATFLALGLSLGVWGTHTSIAGAVIGQGRLEPTVAAHEVSHSEGGVVSQILVGEGDVVAAGDPLVKLDTALLETRIEALTDRLATDLVRAARVDALIYGRDAINVEAPPQDLSSLEHRIADERILLERERRAIAREERLAEQRIVQVREQISGVQAELAARRAEAAILAEDLANKRTLVSEGVQSAASLVEQEREYRALAGMIGGLSARGAELGERRVELEIAQAAIRKDAIDDAYVAAGLLRDRVAETRPKRAELLMERERSVIRAPISGVVHSLPVTGPGYVVQPGREVALIVPQTEALRAVVRVATADIDQVYPSQDVRVRVRSFNARAIPLARGAVETIGADAIYDEEQKRWFYEVRVSLPEVERARLGDKVLINGMELTAFLQTTPLRPLDYIAAPIADYLGRSFRDR